MEEANKLIGTGKKHLVMGKVVEAVSSLQEACSMLAKKYGDTADECGEAFLWCGKALLELARMENSVLGNALEGVPEEEEDEDKPKDSNVESTENVDEKTRDALRVQVYDAMAEKKAKEAEKVEEKQGEDATKAAAADKQPKAEKAEGDEEKKGKADGGKSDKGDEKKEDEEAASAGKDEEAADGEEEGEDVEMEGDAEEEGEGEATAEKDEEEEEEEEEVGNLQLAWEMLEVAKAIYKRNETKEGQLLAAQTYLKLGEVSTESGNYSQAVEDFQECLKLQTAHLDPDSRLLAETHYQLGVTYNLNFQNGRAIEALNSSVSVIKSRLNKLQELIDNAEGPEARAEERKEMEELKALLPEIQEKVEDAAEEQKTASKAAEAVKGMLDGGATSSAFPAASDGDSSTTLDNKAATPKKSTAPVSDISHLVRKKRKPEESPVKESVVKKVKQDDVQVDKAPQPQTDAVQKTNGTANGHAKEMETDIQ